MIDVTELALPRGGGVVLRGTATGSGPTVLLLHAGGEDRRVWAPVAQTLAESGVRAVAFDLRGHGESPGHPTTLDTVAGDVEAMVDGEPTPLAVVGASLGGLAAIAMLAGAAAARRVAGLVLVDVVPGFDPARVRPWLDQRGLRRGRFELAEDILGRSEQLLASAAATDLPITLVRGGPSSPLDDRDIARFQRANERVTVVCVPSAGHLIARDAPHELAHVIARTVSDWLPRAAG